MAWASRGPVQYSGPGVFDMPVLSPYRHKPLVPRERKTPGDPRCSDCRKTERGWCPGHEAYHHAYDPAAGVG